MTALIVAYHIFKLYYRNIVAWKSNQFNNGKFASAAQCTGEYMYIASLLPPANKRNEKLSVTSGYEKR